MAGKFLGIGVTPANVQSEGLAQVFNNLEYVRASAIALDPWLLHPATHGTGTRMPDLHIDGHQRRLARPLWGRRELFVKAFLGFEPAKDLYREGGYRPRREPLPFGVEPDLLHRIIDEARKRGMQTFMEIAPLLPPDPRPEDVPVRVDGAPLGPPRVADTVCLNSPDAQHFALALVQDLLQHYPAIEGLILDWVEFGAYRLEDHFTCFCPHCRARALSQGFDWDAVRDDVSALWQWLHALTPDGLERSRRVLVNPSEILELLVSFPGWLAFLQFKAGSVVAFYQRVRERLDRLGRADISLTARGWCPPWNRSSGMAYRLLAAVCQAVAPKFFAFDHAVIPRWIGETLLHWNPGLSEPGVLDAVIDWLDLADDVEERTFDHYQIPAPEAPHPARMEVYDRRINEVVAQVAGQASCYPIAHPYLPEEQWKEMVALFRDSRADGIWVNFYSYLSDSRLETLRQIWSP